jgi:hypothetical protein
MTRESLVKKALGDSFVKSLLEKLSVEDRSHVENFAKHMAEVAEDAMLKTQTAVGGKMPSEGISDSKGGSNAV